MTTVGYGDFYPSTVFGRWIACLVWIWGALVFPFLASTLLLLTKLNENQSNAYKQVCKHRDYYKVRQIASNCISEYFKYRYAVGKFYDHEENRIKAKNKLKKLLIEFRNLRISMINTREQEPLDVQYDNLSTKTEDLISDSMRSTTSVNRLAQKIKEAETLQLEIQDLWAECFVLSSNN
jgi:hypothetical protein